MDTKNVHFSEILAYYLAVGHSVSILYLRLMPTTSSLLYSARIMLWTCHFIYMFVSVLCSILKYKLLLCFVFFVLSSKIFYLTLCQLNLYFLCLFFVLCVSAIFLHAPLTNIWKVLNSVSRSWVFQLANSWNSKQWKCWFVWKRLKKFILS